MSIGGVHVEQMLEAASISKSTADLLDEGSRTQNAAEVLWKQAKALEVLGQFEAAAPIEASAHATQAAALATLTTARTTFNTRFAALTATITSTPGVTSKAFDTYGVTGGHEKTLSYEMQWHAAWKEEGYKTPPYVGIRPAPQGDSSAQPDKRQHLAELKARLEEEEVKFAEGQPYEANMGPSPSVRKNIQNLRKEIFQTQTEIEAESAPMDIDTPLRSGSVEDIVSFKEISDIEDVKLAKDTKILKDRIERPSKTVYHATKPRRSNRLRNRRVESSSEDDPISDAIRATLLTDSEEISTATSRGSSVWYSTDTEAAESITALETQNAAPTPLDEMDIDPEQVVIPAKGEPSRTPGPRRDRGIDNLSEEGDKRPLNPSE